MVEKRLGALPVVAGFLRRLDVAGTVDRACPIGERALSTHGQIVEALIANRLTSPLPLQHVAHWARDWAVEEVLGLSADILNDDRLARALDAIAPNLEGIVGSVGARAIDVFGLDVARMHWDMTSMSLHGAYEENEDDYPTPAYGHPKDRRTDLKQIQAGLAVTGDGGVPVFHRAYDGGAAEVSQVTTAMTNLSAMAGERNFLLVGDSKLISWNNVGAMTDAGVGFIAPLAAARVPAGLFASLDQNTARPVEYAAQRDANKPADQRCSYRVLEDTMELTGPRKRDRAHRLRRILVHSSANATAAANARALKLKRTAEELDKLTRTAGSRYYPDGDAVTRKITQIISKRKVTAYLRTEVTIGPDTAKPTLAWFFDQQAIDAEAATDGWYALLSNLDPKEADAAEVLIRYKGQPTVERRYSDFKGPLAVTPMFLHHNRRIAALITVICLALLIFCLIEREVRRALLPATGLIGFYAFDNRTVKPTGRLILHALSRIRYQPGHNGSPPKILIPDQIQVHLLELLKIDPSQPRWTTE
ncbi:IS1634 family transposase (plasmid) [Streptomyces sp. NBC_01426]|uniref:IS1634 family transposase n=1 Tax=Streptomyces sp. NBC_01426 TaxID=2975866 RepID=UPI002E2EF0AD|nr:IS1634 family transposase [Streptomyces sp. NBC_01426]